MTLVDQHYNQIHSIGVWLKAEHFYDYQRQSFDIKPRHFKLLHFSLMEEMRRVAQFVEILCSMLECILSTFSCATY